MTPSIKLLTGLISALSLSVGIGYSALAQTNPSSGRTPGQSNDPAYTNPQNNPQNIQDQNQQFNNQNQQFNNQNQNQQFNNQRSQSNIIVPSSADSESIERIVSESPSFTMFNSLLRVANLNEPELVQKLGGDRDFTVYAPTDQAFAALPEGTIRRLVQPENRDLLVQILSYHIVAGNVSTDDDLEFSQAEGRESIAGEQNLPQEQSDRGLGTVVLRNDDVGNTPVLRSDRASGNMMVNNARVIGGSIQAENGTIYPIDQVIIPPSVGTELGLAPQQGTSNQAF
jgi:uncharacterized surface protein with fasciclin (FAS1) repeats